MKGKYITTSQGEIILFPETIVHSEFKHLNPISAGFFYINADNQIVCHGKSISLGLSSHEEDSDQANLQFQNLND